MKIIDFNDCKLSIKDGAYGGNAGNKDGVIYNGEKWLIKYPKNLSQMIGDVASYSTSPLSEYLGSHIFEILGYNVHHTELGIRKNKLVVACKDIENDSKLLEIRTIKNTYGEQIEELLTNNNNYSSSITHCTNLEELLLHIDKNPILSKIENIKQFFFEQAIVDILIGNNDRNSGNWGILRSEDKPDCISPIFDNGACFSTKFPEHKIASILESAELTNNCCNILTAYGINEHHLSAKKFIKEVHNIPEYRNAIKKVIPNIEKQLNKMFDLINDLPETYKDTNGNTYTICTELRKRYYITQLQIRTNYLLRPEYDLIMHEELINEQININDDRLDAKCELKNYSKSINDCSTKDLEEEPDDIDI